MILGYLMIGAFTGLLAFIIALLSGASGWLAFGLYALVGAAGTILLPAAKMIASLAGRANTPAATDGWKETGNPHSAKLMAGKQGAIIEAPMRILAVDDDPFILELIPKLSAKAGFSEVTPAASGELALKFLTGSDMIFDCLLLDISMPGMDGIELCRRVRQMPHYHETPIIMLTAMRDVANMGDAYRAGATDYATKPFDIEELGTRLQLAQETIHAQRDTGPARQEGTGYNWRPVRNDGFKMPKEPRLEGVGSLVNHSVMFNYLTQLPRKEVTDIQVFAVSIDGIEAVHARSSPEQFVALLEDLAATAVECFGADKTVMSYTDNATLLIAINSANPLPAINVEIDIERRLQRNVSEYDTGEGTGIGVSVGGPIQPQSAKTERARMTTDHVIALAENRSLDKLGRPVAGLFQR